MCLLQNLEKFVFAFWVSGVQSTLISFGKRLFSLEWLNLFFLSDQDARQKFRAVLVEATVKLDELVKKIGKAVEESKPYWEARRLARQVSQQ